MKQQKISLFVLLLVCQILMCNYIHLGQYVMPSILPVMVLFIPIKYSTIFCLFCAFVFGFAVDLLVDGFLGLNVASLLVVALVKRSLIRFVFGEDLFIRKENISIKKNTFSKISFMLIIAQAIFLFIYILIDGAATRPLLFNLLRFVFSLIVGYILSLIVSFFFSTEKISYARR